MSVETETDNQGSAGSTTVVVQTEPETSQAEAIAPDAAVLAAETAIVLAEGQAALATQQAAEVIVEHAHVERTQDEQIQWLEERVSALTTTNQSLEERLAKLEAAAVVTSIQAEVATDIAVETAETLDELTRPQFSEPEATVETTAILETTEETSSTTSEVVPVSAEQSAVVAQQRRRERRFL